MKVLSYNICEGGEGILPAIAVVIRTQHPDVVALLEANSRANVEWLANDLGMDMVFGEANCAAHIAWLSRLPIDRWENHRHPSLAKTLLHIVVNWRGEPLDLFATHLGSRWDVPQPATEIPVILDMLHPLGDRQYLLVGDFNALAPGDPVGIPPHGEEKRGDAADGAPRPAIRLLRESGMVDCYRTMHPGISGYTYPAMHPWLRLDYLFASPALALSLEASDVNDAVSARHASDHLPIWATFR